MVHRKDFILFIIINIYYNYKYITRIYKKFIMNIKMYKYIFVIKISKFFVIT